MHVKWTERMSLRAFENFRGMLSDEADPSDFDKEREGEVLGVTRSFWGDTYLTVACNDGRVRDVLKTEVKILADKQ